MNYKTLPRHIAEGRLRKKKMIDWFKKHREGFVADIAQALGFKMNHCRVNLNELTDQKHISRTRKVYEATGYPSNYYIYNERSFDDRSLEYFHKFCTTLTEDEMRKNGAFTFPYVSEARSKKAAYRIKKR